MLDTLVRGDWITPLQASLTLVPARRCHKYPPEFGGLLLLFLVGLGDCLELLRFVFDEY